MVDQELLKQAQDRYSSKNTIRDNHYNEDMDSFILRLYLQCDPAGYGKVFVKKILRDHDSTNKHGINIYPMLDKVDNGDVGITYPKREYFSGKFFDPRVTHCSVVKYENIAKRFFEVKISYLGKNDTFTVRNIRPYQNFDYYILCFVDCRNNFSPRFYVVDKKVITDGSIFTLTPMNGTKKANKDNTDIGYGLSFKRNHWKDLYLEGRNLMKGTTYEHLTEFLSEQCTILKDEFERTVKVSKEDIKEMKRVKDSIKKQVKLVSP